MPSGPEGCVELPTKLKFCTLCGSKMEIAERNSFDAETGKPRYLMRCSNRPKLTFWNVLFNNESHSVCWA